MSGVRTFLFVIYLLVGLYFLNIFFGFVGIPESFKTYNAIISLVGGILIILGGVNHLRVSRRVQTRPA